jgi:uncharacterized beta-barrel protein YwiB (DUF1934 family)
LKNTNGLKERQEKTVSKKVLISVKTRQYFDGQPEEIELITEGKYFKEGSNYVVVYDESEISGMKGTTTTLKIEKDALSIIRSGTTKSNLVFKKNHKHISLYDTPYGTIELTVKPSKVDIDVNDEGGKVKLEYKMESPGLEIIENALELNIKQLN